MAQINTTLTSKLSAPHLKSLKKQELLDLYQKLHEEYGQHKTPELENEDEETTS